ncbi:MAG: hypothetical protein A3C88_02010 [Candidatus Yanofskybacteria bacterium RIFCSPHIGHO2_02_FULL_50_12]|uniref:Uncharacterized protein n=1 Tax=Candidatus Yanofskybacteria bacterium RIFCSPHIGHO2_02_FULL_50_12 TaxID=1802685 RepID=A0A1F8FYJ6_9BACT|nr:MAG: hypothetical protein A3C88_02010 [Candidatus Yanofskybacteria bacterium RIFCSPHIGHO2_02_FULL_50_12]
MEIPRVEKKSNPESRQAVARDLDKLFQTLKEHLGSLTSEDARALSMRFTSEVDDYLKDLIKRLEESRK